MSFAATSRADLVRLLAALPRDEWDAAARTLNYRPTNRVDGVNEDDDRSPLPVNVSTPPYQPAELPDQPFWRIAAQQRLPGDPSGEDQPAWLDQARAWQALPLSDPNQSRPEQAELIPRARQARFLRRQLAQPRGGTALDVARLCRLLAERRLGPRLPCQPNPRWPARLHLVLDLSLPLRPYWEDFWHLEARLRRILGERLQVWHSREGNPTQLVQAADGRPGDLPADDGSLVFLSDAGMYAPGSGRQQRWQHLGHDFAKQGVQALLIAPVPPRLADAGLAHGFRVVLWDRGANLHLLHRAATVTEVVADRPTGVLLTAIAHASRVEPPLLRALRLALENTDIGSEYETWNHANVRNNVLACALAAGHRSDAAAAFRQLPEPVQQRVEELRHQGNRHLSPLIQAEESLAAGSLTRPEELNQVRKLLQGLRDTLHLSSDPATVRALAGYVTQLAARRPELLGLSRELATAWAIAQRDSMNDGSLKTLPPGIELADLRWLLTPHPETRSVFLGQIGDELGVFPAGQPQPACHLADLEMEGDYWQVESVPVGDGELLPSPAGGRAGDEGTTLAIQPTPNQAPTPQTLHLDTPLTLDPAHRYHLTLGRQRLELEAVRRPVWAVGMGRDQDGLFAELADGRRVYWVGKGEIQVTISYGIPLDGQSNTTLVVAGEVSLEFPQAFWWDETEYRAWLQAGRKLEKPPWATRHGVDDSGYWAEFEVKGVVQRLRWISPGEFLMGSPKTEKERESWGNDETQHDVLLTQDYWLADTACTQALWQAVLDEAPSRFKDGERPVEQVTWDDINNRFLPALNRLVPGLDVGLPTEAQWEYACRAGTTTPFSFGETITTEQVNYNGNHPFGKGEYRNQTIPVKALPANAWGLYQMHGNVWEWCEDWRGDYPREAVVDPLGASAGRERVLRGGGWFNIGKYCRSAGRHGYGPGLRYDDFGFRLARGPSSRQAASGGVVDGGGAPAVAADSPTRGQGRTVKNSAGKARKK